MEDEDKILCSRILNLVKGFIEDDKVHPTDKLVLHDFVEWVHIRFNQDQPTDKDWLA